MVKTTNKVKAVVKALAVKSVQFACGTASTNHFCQTKEPNNDDKNQKENCLYSCRCDHALSYVRCLSFCG